MTAQSSINALNGDIGQLEISQDKPLYLNNDVQTISLSGLEDGELLMTLEQQPTFSLPFEKNRFNKLAAKIVVSDDEAMDIAALTDHLKNELKKKWKIPKLQFKDPVYKDSIDIKFPFSGTVELGDEKGHSIDVDSAHINKVIKKQNRSNPDLKKIILRLGVWYKNDADKGPSGGIYFTLKYIEVDMHGKSVMPKAKKQAAAAPQVVEVDSE